MRTISVSNFKKHVSLHQKCLLVLKKQPKIADLRVIWRCDVWIIEGCSEGPGNLIPGAMAGFEEVAWMGANKYK